MGVHGQIMKYLQIFLCLLGGIYLCNGAKISENSTAPACSTLQDIEGMSGTLCQNGTETKKKRDKLLEKLVGQAWRAIDISHDLDLGLSVGETMDPLNISKIIPGGSFHVDRAAGYYKVNLWLKSIVMHGLSKMDLKQVRILRSSDLKQMEIAAHFGLGDLMVNGTYNTTGHLGTVWLQLPWTVRVISSSKQPWSMLPLCQRSKLMQRQLATRREMRE
eukprot:TRINITY_DN35883_c0_g1_i1.p1 TRINITY_DN35883_c0_g1~~TRINITY_DN35883_c0_g1_i1.p1  ORF type:complete len:237 (-),score=36.76 TRINITY_DN35883_c0_g1_i1:89-742(-)